MPGAKHKKSKKNGQRRAAAARTAAPALPRRDGEQPPALPPGLTPAKASRAGLTPAKASRAGLTPAKTQLPGLTPAKGLRLDPVPETGEYSKLVPGTAWPTGPVSVRPADRSTAAAEPPTAKAEPPSPAGEPDGLPTWAAKAIEEVLTVTYWLDPGEHGDPFHVTIRFSGRRADVTGKPGPGDTFSQDETIEGIIPGSGPVAITAEVRGIRPGPWAVTARPAPRSGSAERRPFRPCPPPGEDAAGACRVPQPRRVPIMPDSGTTVHTARLLRAKVPGITRFAYATLTSLGVLAGLGLEAVLLITGHYHVLRPLMFSVAAVVAGVVGGKAWYAAVNRGRRFDGWCIQGFVVGAVVVVAAAAVAGPGLPAGAFLSAAAPALMIGMGIGRFGCFWAGCCTGRPTASRWGVWSSDRRLGCRRAPAQPMEAVAALATGAAVLAVVLIAGLHRSGPVAVAGLAAYTLCRQFTLGLRAEPRRWRYGRRVNAAVAAVVLIVSAALLVRG